MNHGHLAKTLIAGRHQFVGDMGVGGFKHKWQGCLDGLDEEPYAT